MESEDKIYSSRNTHTILHFTISPKALWPVKKGENERATYSEKKKK